MNKKPHILIVEDEPAIHAGLTDVFIYHGYDVSVAEDGEAALELALGQEFALILLDIMLPKLSGFDVCERVREQRPDQPIIMLTAKVSDDDIVHGLRLGADDYVAKPFSIEQLVLRVGAVLRRSETREPEPKAEVRLGELNVDVANLEGTSADGKRIHFTRREMEVLTYLDRHDRPVPREEILAKVWGYANHELIETRTVDIHIAKLRKKIEPDPKNPRHVITVRGAGYKLVVEP